MDTVSLPAGNWPLDILLDPTWHAWTNANTIGFERHFELYRRIVSWIHTQQISPDDCIWEKIGDCIYVRFKNETDYLMFVLRFGLQG